MTETKTITVKVTPRALALVRRIAAKTGEKQYAVFERLAENEMEIHKHWASDRSVPVGAGWMDTRHPRKPSGRNTKRKKAVKA